ncbi:MAG: hypothetical protein AB1298_08665 [Bacteroidota bacterium]
MKSNLKYVLLVLMAVVVSSKILSAQNNDESGVKSALNSLFDFSKSKAYEKAALLIAYDGEDKNRVQKDAFNPANKEELNQVKRICKKISALIELCSKHEFGTVRTKNDGVKDIYTIEVNFISGDQKLVTSFSFVKGGKGYLLVNMN